MKCKHSIAALAMFALSTVSSAQDDPRTALSKTRDEWHACTAKEVIELDDRISPASEIAAAVQTRCVREHDAT